MFVGLLFFAQVASAFYDPALGRWLNRDPLGGPRPLPEATGILENELMPFEFAGGANLFHYVKNSPVSQSDAFGLDLWILRDTCGSWGHEWVIGSNADGTYWDIQKEPGPGPFSPANCPAKITFNEKSGFDPNNPDKCQKVVRHITTSPAIDKNNRHYAEKRSKKPERYDAASCNCRHFSGDFYHRTKRLRKEEGSDW